MRCDITLHHSPEALNETPTSIRIMSVDEKHKGQLPFRSAMDEVRVVVAIEVMNRGLPPLWNSMCWWRRSLSMSLTRRVSRCSKTFAYRSHAAMQLNVYAYSAHAHSYSWLLANVCILVVEDHLRPIQDDTAIESTAKTLLKPQWTAYQ